MTVASAHTASAASPRSSRSRAVLLPVLALIVACCAVTDQRSGPPAVASVAPVGAAPVGAASSAWYCPMVLASHADPTAGAVTILNPANTVLTGTATVVPISGSSVDMPFSVAARTRLSLNPGTRVDATYAAVLLHLDGGGAAVEQYAHTAQGDQSTPCASTTSQNWYFAGGTTESGASLQIALFNPFAGDAIADAVFDTSEGSVQPQEFQGVVIPAHSLIVLDVSGHVRRRDWVATSISLRSGRIVADQMQTGVINGQPGLGYTLGAQQPALNEYLPALAVPNGRREGLAIYNPNGSESEVEVEPLLDKGSAQPFDLHVPANGRVVVNFDTESRIPKDVAFGALVKVSNGVGVVSQLTVTAAPPAPASGGSFTLPLAAPAKMWLVGAAATGAHSDEWIDVLNPGSHSAIVQLTLTGDGNAAAQPTVRIDPGHRYVLHLNDVSPGATASAVVLADQDVVVSREIDVAPGPNIALAPAIAVRS